MSPFLWSLQTCEGRKQVKPWGRRPTQVTVGAGEAGREEVAGVAEEGMSPERPQSKLNHRAPQSLDKGQGWRRWEGGGR